MPYVGSHCFRQVCGNSAKVQLNIGIVEKRYQNWDAALEHFRKAVDIEPTYCEPIYWTGATLVNKQRLKEGLVNLERALDCRYTTIRAFEAIHKVYGALTNHQKDNPLMFLVRFMSFPTPECMALLLLDSLQ